MNRKKKYRLVTQLGEWACGVACVASALGISYRDALNCLQKYKGGKVSARPFGLELEPIISVMSDFGIRMTEQTGNRKWPLGTIAFLLEDEGKYAGGGHYLLRCPDGWMDPWWNYPRTPRVSKYREELPERVQVALVPEAIRGSIRLFVGEAVEQLYPRACVNRSPNMMAN